MYDATIQNSDPSTQRLCGISKQGQPMYGVKLNNSESRANNFNCTFGFLQCFLYWLLSVVKIARPK